MKILITSPSLDTNKNVSGISSIVAPLVNNFDEFIHVEVGANDKEKLNYLKKIYKLIFVLVKTACLKISTKAKIIHINTAANLNSLIRDLIIIFLSKILFLKVITHFHGGYWLTSSSTNFIITILIKLVVFISDEIIVLGEDELLLIRDKYRVQRHIHILSNYIDPCFFDLSGDVKIIEKSIIFIGRLVESKRCDKLAFILKSVIGKHPSCKLYVCGEGPLKNDLLQQLSCINRSQWEFCGVVTGERKIQVLRKSDIYILPSRSGEGMPIALIEAMACGCIPVVTKMGAIGTVVEDNVNGYLAAPDNLNSLIDKICIALENKNNNNDKLRFNAVNCSKKFNIEVYRKSLNKIYSCVTERED